MSPRTANRRIRLLLLFLVAVFSATLVRAVWLQGVKAQSLSRMALDQHREQVTIPARRGTIYDRTGLQLAIGEQATTVYADPKQVRDPEAVARAAARVFRLDAAKLERALGDRSRRFVYVRRKADPVRAADLKRQKLPGLGFYSEERRIYPLGTVAAHVLGFAGVDNEGVAGLERSLEPVLKGRPGRETIVKDPFGRPIDFISSVEERKGDDVILTLDHTLQANAETVLRETVWRWRAKAATAIVLDPRTGGVLAMAVAPGLDANRYDRASLDRQRMRAVTDTYEPGSTFKLVTVAGALSERIVTPKTAFTLPYSIQVADRRIHDSHARATEQMSVARIFSRSSNVGTVTLAQKLGQTRLARWISRFGFGRRTGIDYPGEEVGIVLPPERWSGSTIGTVPIGQGIAVTPIQMASAYAAIANRGVFVRPHVVDHVAGARRPRVERRRIVSRTVAAQLVALLQNVVAEGTGELAAVPGYKVAGKTGTAQKPDRFGGYARRYVASFVGFVPASSPRLVVLVMVDEPQGAIWGGVVAAPAFQQIARFGLHYLEIPPDAPTG
ncbi:MAG: penicillin-binding protein 2 [Actinobacteria bacterium]|nr:penicillin-binding protein 2 [Actinomycetota bacterium]